MTSEKRIKNQVLKNQFYGNYKVLNISGEHIFSCADKKIKWYLKKGLAKIVQEDPLVIQLNFITKGNGHAGDNYYLQDFKDRCVVCGTGLNLTRHHIIPYCYRKFFDYNIKNHSYHDVLLLCLTCHNIYEESASAFKNQLSIEYAIDNKTFCNKLLRRVNIDANTLLKYGTALPIERQNEIMSSLQLYYGKEDLTQEDIDAAAKIEYMECTTDKTDAQLIVEKIDDMDIFMRRWREHFQKSTNAQFLPTNWNIEGKEER